MIRNTYTYAVLDVTPETYYENYDKIKRVAYEHYFHESAPEPPPVFDVLGFTLSKVPSI